jgi:2-desacetyl-2-hydroxyethyl bacteriochlorophyllide A dehydrogenase
MRSQRIVVTAKEHVELQDTEISNRPDPGHVLIASMWSVISTGTEIANYSALDAGVHSAGTWNSYPWVAGYGNVGVVLATGEGVRDVAVGQRVFTHGPHASHFHYGAERLIVPLPDGIDPALAAATRMAGVALTGPMAADLGCNRWVAVLGLGLVGNLAAQICHILGARVVGIDPSPARRMLAERCGIPWTLGGAPAEVARGLGALCGMGANVVIDAVGRSEASAQAVALAAPYGQVIILGTPRAPAGCPG